MGVAFALGLVLLILMIIGAIGVLVGTIMLIVRFIKKKKTEKKYRVVQVLGIIFIILGSAALAIPLVLGGVVISSYRQNEKRNEYWTGYADTDNKIQVEENALDADGTRYLLYEFEFNDKIYKKIDGMTVQYKDEYRKEAVANMVSGKKEATIYKYKHPKAEDALSIHSEVYATEDSIKQLKEYYNNDSDYSYICDYYMYEGSGEFKVNIEDDMYIDVINCEPKYVTFVNEDYKCLNEYDIIQTSSDKRLERCLEVNVCEDDRVVIRVKENPLKNNIYTEDEMHEVLDANVKKEFVKIYEEMLKREGVDK